jgi:hypothetical protein
VVRGRVQGRIPAGPRPTRDDAGLVKIRNDGSEVVWATWIGGKGIDSQPGSVRVDPAGSPYMLFYTDASDLKTTPGAHDASHNGGKDLFLAKFSPDGAKLLLGTYLGGSGDDTLETHALSLDAAGNIYAMAITGSNDFPTTPGAFQESFGGKADVAVAKFDPSGKFLAATYVGGSGGEGPDGLSVSADGEVLFVGETNSTDFPVTPGRVPVEARRRLRYLRGPPVWRPQLDGLRQLFRRQRPR